MSISDDGDRSVCVVVLVERKHDAHSLTGTGECEPTGKTERRSTNNRSF